MPFPITPTVLTALTRASTSASSRLPLAVSSMVTLVIPFKFPGMGFISHISLADDGGADDSGTVFLQLLYFRDSTVQLQPAIVSAALQANAGRRDHPGGGVERTLVDLTAHD